MSPESLRESFRRALAELPVQEAASQTTREGGNISFPEIWSAQWWIWVILLGVLVLSLFGFLAVIFWNSRVPDRKIKPSGSEDKKGTAAGVSDWFSRAEEAWNRGNPDQAAGFLYSGVLVEAGELLNRKGLFELTAREIAGLMPPESQESFRALARLHARSRFGGRPWNPGEWAQAWDLVQRLRRGE